MQECWHIRMDCPSESLWERDGKDCLHFEGVSRLKRVRRMARRGIDNISLWFGIFGALGREICIFSRMLLLCQDASVKSSHLAFLLNLLFWKMYFWVKNKCKLLKGYQNTNNFSFLWLYLSVDMSWTFYCFQLSSCSSFPSSYLCLGVAPFSYWL